MEKNRKKVILFLELIFILAVMSISILGPIREAGSTPPPPIPG